MSYLKTDIVQFLKVIPFYDLYDYALLNLPDEAAQPLLYYDSNEIEVFFSDKF